MATASDKQNSQDLQLEELQKQLIEKEAAIKELETKLSIYESAASGSNDGLWYWDIQESQTFVSDPWKVMLGLPIDEKLDNQGWIDRLHPSERDEVVRVFKNFIVGKENTYEQEFRMLHGDGTYRWIYSRAKAIRDENGKALKVSGSHTDITEKKLAMEFIRKSEAKYRTLFENSLVAMFRMKIEDGQIIDANGKVREMLEEKTLGGKSFYNYLGTKNDHQLLIKHILTEKGIDNLELQLKTACGNTLWVSFAGAHYKDDKEIDCVLKDITQTKENLLELQKVNFELDSFVYHASHDLRSPLRSVLGLIDLYRMEETQSIRNECIEKIESSIKRLDLLVMDLLSISRNDRINEPTREINLMNEVNSSISSYFNASNTKNLEIITRILHPVKFVSDLTRVRIILNNLISNAIKYRSFHKDRSLIIIDIKVNEKVAVISIEDNGEGIEESKVPHIFDMFYRATEKSEGSGLGLYIVKKVADKLNAQIEVDSVELEGTKFIVTIPNLNNNLITK